MGIIRKFISFYHKYPTYGRPLHDYPNNVKLWIIISTIISVILSIVGIILSFEEKIDFFKLFFFIIIIIVFKMYYNYFSYKSGSTELLDISGLFTSLAIIFFRSEIIVLLIIAINMMISYLFGVRRLHAIVYNSNVQIISTFPVLYLTVYLLPLLSGAAEIILFAMVVSIIQDLIHTRLIKIIINIAMGKFIFNSIFSWKELTEEIFTIVISTFSLTYSILNPETFLLIIIALWIILKEQVLRIKAIDKITDIKKVKLDTIGTPIAIIEGNLKKMQVTLTEKCDNYPYLTEHLKKCLDQIKKVKLMIEKTRE